MSIAAAGNEGFWSLCRLGENGCEVGFPKGRRQSSITALYLPAWFVII